MEGDRKGKGRRAPEVSRRRFLGQASCAAVGTVALYNTVLNMGMFNTLACDAPNYKGLVCLFLSGGIDSFNMLVPRSQAEYDEYAAVRADLALPLDSLLPIVQATSYGREYGMHPGLIELHSLFEQGRLALVANVGTLVEPTTLQQYQNRSVALPLGLFSHSDQSMHWQTSVPDQRNASGWAGRMADILQEGNCNQKISMNISLSGSNVFQSGEVTSHYTIDQNGSRGLRGYGGTSPDDQIFTQAVDGLLGQHYQHVFEQTFAARMRGAIDAHIDFSTAMRRQTFFVNAGGWDHHDEVVLSQEAMLPVISAALGEFYSALEELGVAHQVTTFTASDFGRTLSSNGRGSDLRQVQ